MKIINYAMSALRAVLRLCKRNPAVIVRSLSCTKTNAVTSPTTVRTITHLLLVRRDLEFSNFFEFDYLSQCPTLASCISTINIVFSSADLCAIVGFNPL